MADDTRENPFTFTDNELKQFVYDYHAHNNPAMRKEALPNALLAQLVIAIRVLAKQMHQDRIDQSDI